jgi:hypothetical protein
MYVLSAIGRGHDQPNESVEERRFSNQALFEPNVGLLLEVPIIDETKPIHRPHNLMRHEQAGFETTTDASAPCMIFVSSGPDGKRVTGEVEC